MAAIAYNSATVDCSHGGLFKLKPFANTQHHAVAAGDAEFETRRDAQLSTPVFER